jgi:hypothetical protein
MSPRGALAFPLASLLVAFVAGAACTPPLRMCTAAGDCGGASSCVAGRCVAHGSVPAISTARRMLYDPVQVGFTRRGADARSPGVPAVAALGGGDGALALARFSVRLPPEATVLEAYVLVGQVLDVDSDPGPIAVHAARVVEPWDERSLSWAVQPRIEEVGSPITQVYAGGRALIRLDVRAIVERWRRRSADDLGIAILAEAIRGRADAGPASRTGVAVALAPGPKLELYVR